jgi:hypothetical protein
MPARSTTLATLVASLLILSVALFLLDSVRIDAVESQAAAVSAVAPEEYKDWGTVTSNHEAEADIIEPVVEQSQVAAAADAAAWYDVLINKVNEFFVDLYQWLKSWI